MRPQGSAEELGTSWPLLAVLFWALAGVGLAAFLRRRPALASMEMAAENLPVA